MGKNPKIGCRDIAEIFKIGKTSATMIKNEEKLCKEYGSFHGMSRFCRRNFTDSLKQCIFGTQMLWSQSVSHRYSYTRRSMQMKEWMVETVPEIGRFHTSNGLFESFKMSYRMQETTIRIAGKGGIVPIMMVKVWIERLPEFMKRYLYGDIRNMDDLGLFFKTLSQKDLVEKGKKGWGGQQAGEGGGPIPRSN